MVLHGHGKRFRLVVVFPATSNRPAQVGECWSRRYRCTACGAVTVVLPDGVMPRFLYSAAAIVLAWLLVTPAPVGAGLDDATAYDRQGMLQRLRWPDRADYRWRSLDRWARQIGPWWPHRLARTAQALVTELVAEVGTDDHAVLGRALASHVRWVPAM